MLRSIINQIAPRGFEPLNENQQAVTNKALTENENPVLSTGLDNLLQKYPDLRLIIERWQELPKHVRQAVKKLVLTGKA
jgi:hypothetical protein